MNFDIFYSLRMGKDVGLVVLQKPPYLISPERNCPPTSHLLVSTSLPHFRSPVAVLPAPPAVPPAPPAPSTAPPLLRRPAASSAVTSSPSSTPPAAAVKIQRKGSNFRAKQLTWPPPPHPPPSHPRPPVLWVIFEERPDLGLRDSSDERRRHRRRGRACLEPGPRRWC
jgi:hypothetical protein